MRFTLKQLEYFLAAAEAGSITVAAACARISQPSISAAISALEAEFGVNLFVRNPAQGIVLTLAGQRLMREVRDIVTRVGGLYTIANELNSVVQGPLSIGCLVTAAPVILPSLLGPFHSAHPGLQLAFADLDQAEIIRRLRLAQIDIALTYDMQLPKDVRFTTLANLRPHVVVASDHPLAQKDVVELGELAEFSYIMLDLPLSREYFLSVFEQGGVSPNITHVSKSPEVVRSLVASGYGATISTIIPRCEIALDGHPITTVPLAKSVRSLPLGLVVLDQGTQTPAVRAFQRYCAERFKESVPGMRSACIHAHSHSEETMPSNEGRRYGGGSHIDACLSRIAAYEEMLHSLVAHDADNVLRQKEEVEGRSGSMPLAGLALGVKDIIDAASYPTVCGSPIYEGVMPRCDAASVAQLREAGAIVMGKTVTTEFAFFSPERTRNPHDGARTPGGSSSGSAAAVAAGFIDVGLGSQTAGSITRPASFCGVVGFKPSFGTYSLAGMKGLSPSFDTLGAFSRDVATIASVHAVLSSAKGEEAMTEPAAPRRIGLCRTPSWDKAEAATRDVLAAAASVLGAEVEVADVDMDGLAEGVGLHMAIMAFEARQSLAAEFASHPEKLSVVLRDLLAEGERIGRGEHRQNLARAEELRKRVEDVTERFDLLLAPAAVGEAPSGLAATGDPVFSRLWTLLRLPTITLPGFTGTSGMPVGVQLLAAMQEDERLLSHALWAEALFPDRPEPDLEGLLG